MDRHALGYTREIDIH